VFAVEFKHCKGDKLFFQKIFGSLLDNEDINVFNDIAAAPEMELVKQFQKDEEERWANMPEEEEAEAEEVLELQAEEKEQKKYYVDFTEEKEPESNEKAAKMAEVLEKLEKIMQKAQE